MTARTDQVDELVEWHPGPPEAASPSPFGALVWGMRRASGSGGLLVALWAAHALIASRLATAVLQPLRSLAAADAAGASWVAHVLGSARYDLPVSGGEGDYLMQVVLHLERPVWSPQPYFVVFYGVFAAAAIGYLHAPRPAPLLAQLGAYAGTYAARFLRLLLIAALALWLGMLLVTAASERVGGDQGAWLATFGVQVLVSFLAITVDFARVRTVARDSRSMLLEVWRAARFVIGNAPRVVGLMLLLWAAGGALTVLGVVAASTIADTGLTSVIESAYALARLWLRLAMWAAMLSLYQGIASERQAVASRPGDDQPA